MLLVILKTNYYSFEYTISSKINRQDNENNTLAFLSPVTNALFSVKQGRYIHISNLISRLSNLYYIKVRLLY